MNKHIAIMRDSGKTFATAESCTGGMVGATITAVPGSSAFFIGGIISYSNAVKERSLRVLRETLARHGAVSGETAMEMAEGARRALKADFAVSVTGVAGPDGGTKKKPVGTVFIGASSKDAIMTWEHHFVGTRAQIRKQTVAAALEHLAYLVVGDQGR